MCILVHSGIDWKDKRNAVTSEIISKLNNRNLCDILEFKPFVQKTITKRQYDQATYFEKFDSKEDFIKGFFKVETLLHCTSVLTLPLCLHRYDIINNSDLWVEYCSCLDTLIDRILKEMELTGNFKL